jgi:cell pole-organizing protein PopZ
MGVVANEPSMEEILSSIKRIIADGSERAPAPRQSRRRANSAPAPQAETVEAAAEELSAEDSLPETLPEAAVDDDSAILELTDAVPEDLGMTEEMVVPAQNGASEETAAPAPMRAATPVAPILSDSSAQAARQSLSHLSSLLVKPDDGESNTLEGLVREMLKPMLKDWLDARLPELVETMVKKEIDRITGRLG